MKSSTSPNLPRTRLNGQIMWPILLVLAVAPYLFGSTKPAAWALWATIIFACGFYFFLRMGFSNARLRISPRNFLVIGVLFLLCAFYMVIQVTPIADLSPAMPTGTQGEIGLPIGTISLTPDDTVLSLVRWLTYGLLFFLVMQLSANQQRAQLFLKIVFWSIVLHAILALLFLLQFGDTILGIPKWKYFGDALGGFINRNSFATFLALGSLIGINMLLPGTMASSKSKAGKARDRVGQDTILIAVGLLILLVTLIATNSRMGVFAALCGMAFSLGLAFFKRIEGVQGFRFWPFLVLLLAAVVFGVVTYGATFTERLGRAGDDAAIRQQLYAQVLEMIRLRPLTGYGGESFERVFPLFHRPPVSVDLIWSKTHSTYLALWSDYGLIFGTLPMLLVAFVFFQLLSIHRRIAGQDALLRCGIGAIVVGAVHSLVDFSLEIEAVTFVFVSILAVACARQYELRNMIEREEAL